MTQEPKRDSPEQSDDPRQSIEEGDPQVTGRVRGRVDTQDEQGTDRNDPDASAGQGKKDVTATTPHRESGDRA